MRFMLFMLPGGELRETGEWEPPTAAAVAEMTRFNEALVGAGVLLAADGLHPPSVGARVACRDGAKTVVDGPFAESKEVVGGYWLIDVRSRAEAVEWASRCPLEEGDVIEIRQVYEMSDFPAEVQAAAELSAVPPEQTSARD
ncbi:MAG: YciI family protein [Solirubrobacterales bacterium]|nr:YciI family protein [Solirubrobacterales bacterium]